MSTLTPPIYIPASITDKYFKNYTRDEFSPKFRYELTDTGISGHIITFLGQRSTFVINYPSTVKFSKLEQYDYNGQLIYRFILDDNGYLEISTTMVAIANDNDSGHNISIMCFNSALPEGKFGDFETSCRKMFVEQYGYNCQMFESAASRGGKA